MTHNKPTIKQKRAMDNLVGNGGNITKAMRDAGYTEATANTPQKLTESKGFQHLMESQGLTDEFVVKALVEDIEDKGQLEAKVRNRTPELTLAAKMKGRLSPDISVGGDLNINIINYSDSNE